MLEETLEILHGLWDEPDGWSFIGKHYAIDDALFRPKPGSLPGRNGGRPRILVGGEGSPRVVPDRRPLRRRVQPVVDEPRRSRRQKYAALDATLREAGRDPSTITRSAMVGLLMGRDRRRGPRPGAGRCSTAFGQAEAGEAWFEPRRARWIHGTPDKARASLAAFEAAGVRADHAPGLPAPGPRDDRARGGVAVRLSAGALTRPGPRVRPRQPSPPSRTTGQPSLHAGRSLQRIARCLARQTFKAPGFRRDNRRVARLAFRSTVSPAGVNARRAAAVARPA